MKTIEVGGVTYAEVQNNPNVKQTNLATLGLQSAKIVHDLNNIIGLILLCSEVGEMRAEADSHASKHFGKIQINAKRAGSFIKSILEFARHEVTEKKSINLGDTLHEIVDNIVRIMLPENTVHIDIDAEQYNVLSNAKDVEQIILNLCSNAWDSMSENLNMKHRLDISLKKETVDITSPLFSTLIEKEPSGKFVTLTVKDTGAGMPQSVIDHMFESFFTTKKAGKGTGLGLSAVHHLVDENNGHITVKSRVGHGTEIKIFFPEAKLQYAANDAPEEWEDTTSKKFVLFGI